MAKPKSLYLCQQCGATTPKWTGQCPECNAWNSLQETVMQQPKHSGAGFKALAEASAPTRLTDIDAVDAPRTATGIDELDRVLGGGLVPGAVILLGGDPGIGKSTLLLQTLASLCQQLACLYITGEESLQQVCLRAQRLGINTPELQLMAETQLEQILHSAEQQQPQIMVIDSIQTVFTDSLGSAPGSIAQVRESAAQLVRYAKQTNTTVLLVGHVTKEGHLAGPRVLEHMVDTVLYFEGDAGERYRVIRAIKNRFGAVNELGVFAMLEQGLKPVSNPSAIFLSRHEQPVTGSVIMVTREGTRPLLVEVQALVDTSAAGQPRRITLGLEQNRLAMLLAVAHRHAGLAVYDQDVYVNIVGGVRVSETAADLAVLLAVLSSFRDRPLPPDRIVFGEIGLAGEIRPVPNGQERIQAAAKHGFQQAIIPHANQAKQIAHSDIELITVQRVQDVLDLC